VKNIASNFSSSFYITCLFQFQVSAVLFFTDTVFWWSWSWRFLSWSQSWYRHCWSWSWSWNSGLDYKTGIEAVKQISGQQQKAAVQ